MEEMARNRTCCNLTFFVGVSVSASCSTSPNPLFPLPEAFFDMLRRTVKEHLHLETVNAAALGGSVSPLNEDGAALEIVSLRMLLPSMQRCHQKVENAKLCVTIHGLHSVGRSYQSLQLHNLRPKTSQSWARCSYCHGLGKPEKVVSIPIPATRAMLGGIL